MKPTHPAARTTAHMPKPGLTRPMTSEERRRAQRVLLRVPVKLVIAGKTQEIAGSTHTVSATGALVQLSEALAQGTKIIIENVTTKNKTEAHVPRPPQFSPEGALVPIEFTGSAVNFWAVFFPPILN